MKYGTCVRPNSLTSESVIAYGKKLLLDTIILFPNSSAKVEEVKAAGFKVGCLVEYHRGHVVRPDKMMEFDFIILGDETNVELEINPVMPAEEYYFRAKPDVEALRAADYSGEIVMACMGPVGGVFKKWWAKLDKDYLKEIIELESTHGQLFDAYGFNPFHCNINRVMKDFEEVAGKGEKIYFAGFGYNNTALDDWFAQVTGSWYRQLRDIKKYPNIVVASTWCMGGVPTGNWGHVNVREGTLMRSGVYYLKARESLS